MSLVSRSLLILAFLGATAAAWGQSYLKVIGDAGRAETGSVAYRSPTGELYIAGGVNDSAMVQRMDADGNVLWSRCFRTPGVLPKRVLHLASAPDGSIIGCGYGRDPIGNPGEGFRFRMDAAGNVIWVRYWEDAGLHDRRIHATSASEYILFSARIGLAGGTFTDIFTARIDAATGDLIGNSGLLDLNLTNSFVDDMIAMTTIGSSHYVVTSTFVNGSPLSGRRVGLSKFDSNGQHITTSYLLYPDNVDRRIYASDICASGDSLTISYFGDINGSSTNWTQGLIRLDTTGAIAWARDFNVGGSGQEISSRVIPTSFGYLVAARTSLAVPSRLFLQAVSPSGVLLWTKSYGNPGQAQGIWENTPANLTDAGGGFLLTGHVDQGAGELDLLLIRTDEDGEIACTQVNALNAITTVLPDLTYPSIVQENFFLPNTGPDVTLVEDAGISDLCVLDVELGNDTSLCGTLTLDPGAIPGALYEWQDGTTGQTLDVTASGTYWVRVTVDCCVASDTVEVALGTLPEVDLGNDTTVCIGGILFLYAPDGPWSIEWSDGQVGPEGLFFEPGTFWVTLTDGGCSASDTVLVGGTQLPTVAFGPDTLSCAGSPVFLQPIVTEALEYLWSEGSTTSSIEADVTGQVWLRVTNQCGNATDTVNVYVIDPIDLDLGPDTVVCEGSPLQLSVDLPGWDLQWSDGSSGGDVAITEGGTYWLDAINVGCSASDTVEVADRPLPEVTLAADTIICGGGPLLLLPQLVDAEAQLWSDGSTAPSLLATASGSYAITAVNGCGTDQDDILVTMVPPLGIAIGPDTVLCGADSLVLDLGSLGVDILWQDTLVSPAFLITGPGTYWVEGEDTGCVERDTIAVAYSDLATLDLGPDTVLCTIPSFQLDAGVEGDNTIWQDGSVGRLYEADRTDLYVAGITNECGTVTDSIRLAFAIPPVPIADVDLCPGELVKLDPQGEMVRTRWTTGDTTRTITVGEGVYGFFATDIHGCDHAGQVFVRIMPERDGQLYVPNAFSPDDDGINDDFRVVGAEEGAFELVVHDRWGLVVHRSVDALSSWDGASAGVPVPSGVYVYTMTYMDRCNAEGGMVTRSGHVMLVR